MLFRQFVDDDLGCASYLIGDDSSGEAVVVDPAFAIEKYLESAKREGVQLQRVLETHTHADHVSGHGRLGLEHDITVAIHPAAEPEYDFEPLEDGAEIAVGSVSIRVVHTPGHRPEHCAFTVSDRARSDEPWLTLTGDSLFVGEAARPDLAVEAAEGARELYHSLQRLLELPDGVEVHPGHVSGSLCGAGMDNKRSTTIGFERRFNRAFAHHDVDEFVAESIRAGVRPPNMERIVELNRGPFVGARPEPPELPLPPEGAQVLDVRPFEDFAAGHLPGALSVPVSGTRFSTKAAFVLDADRPLVVAASDEHEAAFAVRGLRSVGFLDLEGYVLGGGPDTLPVVEVDELDGLLAEGAELVDVREKDERDSGYIAGSRNIPYRLLALGEADLPRDRPLVTICESGPRAAIAASILAARGFDARAVATGGIDGWAAAGGSTVEFRRCGG